MIGHLASDEWANAFLAQWDNYPSLTDPTNLVRQNISKKGQEKLTRTIVNPIVRCDLACLLHVVQNRINKIKENT